MPRDAPAHLGLARAVRQLREQRGRTQEHLAYEAGVTATSLARLESGRVNPSWATVRGIARALDVPMSELAALADELDPPAGR